MRILSGTMNQNTYGRTSLMTRQQQSGGKGRVDQTHAWGGAQKPTRLTRTPGPVPWHSWIYFSLCLKPEFIYPYVFLSGTIYNLLLLLFWLSVIASSYENPVGNHLKPMIIAESDCNWLWESCREPSKTYDYSWEWLQFPERILSRTKQNLWL